MATKVKTVLLYDVRKVRPQTLQAFCDAQEGECIPVERGELDSFMPVTLLYGEAERMFKEKTGQSPAKKKK